jgi:beta-glucanase (GH16 family)
MFDHDPERECRMSIREQIRLTEGRVEEVQPRDQRAVESAAAGPVRGSRRAFRPRRAYAVATAIAVLIAAIIVAQRFTSSGWTTVFSDNFSGAAGSRPSAASWITDKGTSYPGGAANWGTGEVETYTDSTANLALDGQGHLKITASKNAAGVWESGKIESTRTDFQAPAGGTLKVESRIRIPNGGQGYWPAFWMLGSGFRGNYTNWPQAGEVDIMENIGREPATVHGTLHCGTSPGGPCYETNGVGGASTQPDGTALSAGFHTFAVEMDRTNSSAGEIRWYVDGKKFFTVHQKDVGTAAWQAATNHGFFVLLNLAVGGGWPGSPDASSKASASMLVDSVTVSRK